MFKELLRVAAAALAAALYQVLQLLEAGGPLDAKALLTMALLTVLVRLASYIVGKWGPQLAP